MLGRGGQPPLPVMKDCCETPPRRISSCRTTSRAPIHQRRRRSAADVRCRRPTTPARSPANRQASRLPAAQSRDGPVMLNSCVSRSITARHRLRRVRRRPPWRHRAVGARDRHASAAATRRSPPARGRPRVAAVRAVHRAHVVFRQDVPAHLQPQPDAGRVPIGVGLEHRRVIPRRFGQHDVQVDVGGACGVLDRDRADVMPVSGNAVAHACEVPPARRAGADRRSTARARRTTGDARSSLRGGAGGDYLSSPRT